MGTEQERRARERADRSPTGIGAAFEQTISLPGEDGQRFRLFASDGARTAAMVARISRTESATLDEIPMLTLERVVERIAGRFPGESRLADLVGDEIILRSGDFRQRDFEPAASSLD
jgi:hypothetical protein